MPQFNDLSSPLSLLLTRRSGKARDLVAPGPGDAELATILQAAARVPDHGKLAPWRFVVIRDRTAFADLLERLYRAEKPFAGRLEIESLQQFARQSPVCVALFSLPRESHIPLWEQLLSAGAVAQNLLLATHALGYAGNWLSGAPATMPGIADALGVPGGTIAGYFFLGTAAKPLEERPRPNMPDIVRNWP
ncbi:nitroreductase family protein [Sandaracinobacteroides hominis]|uniref:nitroreductase family protein n=1 Tax=Sandaracinobacteroides hominis TaxID=2780086 RepID=UPI0018F66D8C|nr:nitroreductase [Sandaracinobacteroides hominis]